ncbi:uncharacterized protein LOC127091223 isoform X1 [Lathyrus oleraceus]|uniref:HMA domain-containing protein n=1 Tax=Pisum sativum TaxID=3888 RepID=A0A9D4WEZ0_PEA|nr:uncharacterized protein LOC127091223 isoform X1 [Pisum sativum]KAI5401533.1 hypothetical protein KIW84_066129 [Pisum sativum]
MAFKDCSINREVQKASGVKVSKSFPLSSLASLESLSLPLVQEVVLSGDMKCENCQKRVSDIINKMNEVREGRERGKEQWSLLCLLPLYYIKTFACVFGCKSEEYNRAIDHSDGSIYRVSFD